MSKSLRDSSVDEETILSEIITQFLSTTSVRELCSLSSSWAIGTTRQQTPLEVSEIKIQFAEMLTA
jgi:hypothetical protein